MDKQFSSVLTQPIKNSIALELSVLLGKISLEIDVESLVVNSDAKQKQEAQEQAKKARQTLFLADSGVKQLEKIFQSKVSIDSMIKIK